HRRAKAEKSRPGQRMLGAVANHAWAEDSLYLSRSGRDDARIDLESKSSPGSIRRMTNIDNLRWEPHIRPWREDESPPEPSHTNYRGRRGARARAGAAKQKQAGWVKA